MQHFKIVLFVDTTTYKHNPVDHIGFTDNAAVFTHVMSEMDADRRVPIAVMP
jgi:hypothetical protein